MKTSHLNRVTARIAKLPNRPLRFAAFLLFQYGVYALFASITLALAGGEFRGFMSPTRSALIQPPQKKQLPRLTII